MGEVVGGEREEMERSKLCKLPTSKGEEYGGGRGWREGRRRGGEQVDVTSGAGGASRAGEAKESNEQLERRAICTWRNFWEV